VGRNSRAPQGASKPTSMTQESKNFAVAMLWRRAGYVGVVDEALT
jgi:hypothetical protein